MHCSSFKLDAIRAIEPLILISCINNNTADNNLLESETLLKLSVTMDISLVFATVLICMMVNEAAGKPPK